MIVFGTVWTLFSSVFVCVGLYAAWQSLFQSAWEKVPCVVERFEILADQKKNPVFEADLKFRYEWEGKSYSGTELRPGDKGESEYEKFSEVREKLLAEARGSDSFSFPLPGSPYSVSGSLIKLTWALELVAEPTGQLALQEFTLSPGKQELLLPVIDQGKKRWWKAFRGKQ